MLVRGFIKEDFHYTPYSTLSYLVLGDVELKTPFTLQILPNELPWGHIRNDAKMKNKDVKEDFNFTPKLYSSETENAYYASNFCQTNSLELNFMLSTYWYEDLSAYDIGIVLIWCIL